MRLQSDSTSTRIKRPTGVPSKLSSLSDAQIVQLIGWLYDEQITYAEAVKRIQLKFGVRTSTASLCRFWESELSPRILEMRNATSDKIPAVVEPPKPEPVRGDTAEILIECSDPRYVRVTVLNSVPVVVRVQPRREEARR